MHRSTALVFVAGLFAASCSSGAAPEPRGAPVLLKVYWIAGGSPMLAWSPPDQPSPFLASPVPPFASEVDFVFDRRLDGDRIEDTVTVNGVQTTTPKAMAPIEVQWPGMAERPGDPPLKLYVAYNSAGRYGPGTTFVFAKPTPQGFPSSQTLMFVLHPDKLTSIYGEPTEAPEKIPVTTGALTVSIMAPTTAATTKFQLPLVFTNRVALGATSPFIHVTSGGGAVPYKLLADASQPSRWYVAPADCLGAWPGDATLVVTVDAGLPDAFGGTLVQNATATFKTGAGPAMQAGATCAVEVPDGGAPEGGAPDGGAGDASEAGGDAVDGGMADGGAADGEAGSVDAGDDADAPASFDAPDGGADTAEDVPAG
jgi:hypothetical protein